MQTQFNCLSVIKVNESPTTGVMSELELAQDQITRTSSQHVLTNGYSHINGVPGVRVANGHGNGHSLDHHRTLPHSITHNNQR